ncbi:aminotransferase class V-fold PLP-dependent enzyme [bacterium]|nr:aminotransferase class V-fold PLP-dependent enzyme [bacterium]
MVFDPELLKEIEQEFPYAHTDPWGKKRVFVDNGPGTLILKRAADAQYHASLEFSSSFGPAFPECRKVDEIQSEGYKAVSDLFNAGSPDTIVMGQTATSLLFQISYALGNECEKRHNVVTTYYEHLANVNPWLELVERGKIKEVRFAHLHEDGTLDMDHLRSLVDENTKVITVSAASNLLGSKSPLKEIGTIARDAGAYYVIDGVHHAAHGHMNVRDIGCDFLVITAYKSFAPKYSGFMFGKQEHLESMRPYSSGKDHGHPRGKWSWGTPDHGKLAAITAVVDYFAWLGDRVKDRYTGKFAGYSGRVRSVMMGMDAIDSYEKEISRAVLTGFDDVPGLPDIPGVSFYGLGDVNRLDERDPTFAFSIEGLEGSAVERRLVDDYNIAIRSILYWSKSEDFFNLHYPVRASFVHYNTVEEVHYILKALRTLVK